ncbi:type II secretion system F family protein [Clostridium tyrobutyricum]|uniref:type II secretion system F family protein n=1 Tax=Clostridium tyrobutyricum TaxID=1519 RepID=UPI001C3897B7|nr:type II secretion system F family protein [Clostridium tyrobutyricum]MBV4415229.1 type II secretion system F family protein [Clostridium tyrobutyricum]MBV4420900.1 type II secretion system F family protein [Clostridium tyrobutyricum]MBV4429796.1 type II secretion system F family protein [Clostridium tyrobutyricum]MBV4435926.1 type II secretion system F family protein [Clostridium tyrobutyricum]
MILLKKLDFRFICGKLPFMKPNISTVAILCSKFSIMFSSGIGISKIFDNIEIQTKNIYLKYILRDIKYEILCGNSIYYSMKKFRKVFPSYMIEMIGIGEEAGRLEDVLKELSKYYEYQHRIYSNLKSALIYPVITFTTAICIIIFLMSSIMPGFIDLLALNNAEIPLLTKLIIKIFEASKEYTFHIIIFIIIGIIAGYRYSKSIKGINTIEKIKLRTPYFGRIYNQIILLKIVSSMKILNFAGVNILKALDITSKTFNNNIMEKKMDSCVKRIKDGEGINSAFSNEKIGNELFVSMIEIGEKTGKLDLMFEKLQLIYIDNLKRSLNLLMKFVEPVMIVFLSIFIGIFVIAAIMPVFSIMDSIS